MKIVYNYIIPFKGYLAMCVFPFIFVRKDARNLTVKDINHEKIHGMQQIETHIVALILAVLLAAVGLFFLVVGTCKSLGVFRAIRP